MVTSGSDMIRFGMGEHEYLDIVDENGEPAGGIISRDEAHQKGVLHRPAAVCGILPYQV